MDGENRKRHRHRKRSSSSGKSSYSIRKIRAKINRMFDKNFQLVAILFLASILLLVVISLLWFFSNKTW